MAWSENDVCVQSSTVQSEIDLCIQSCPAWWSENGVCMIQSCTVWWSENGV